MSTTAEIPDLDTELGQLAHTMLWQQRISQTTAADHLGISQSALSRSLRGERRWRIAEVVALAALLGVPITDLLPRLDSNQQPFGLRIASAAWRRATDWTRPARADSPRIPTPR